MDICLECFSVVNENNVKDKMRSILDKIITAAKKCIDTLIRMIDAVTDIMEDECVKTIMNGYAELTGIEPDDDGYYNADIWKPLLDVPFDTNLSIDGMMGLAVAKKNVDAETFNIMKEYNDNYSGCFDLMRDLIKELLSGRSIPELKSEDYQWLANFSDKINPKIIGKCTVADIMYYTTMDFMGGLVDSRNKYKTDYKKIRKTPSNRIRIIV